MKRNWSNLVTLALAVVVLLSGIILPNMIYPLLDPFMEQITLLEVPSDSESSLVFSGPPSLYPMNLYNPENTRPINPEEEQLLTSLRIMDFLLSLMSRRGMPVLGMEAVYSDRLLSSFEYLETNSDKYLPCFVMNGCDIDNDGKVDLQCAVNQRGIVIFYLILNEQWSKVIITLENTNNQPPASDTDGLDAPTSNQGPTGLAPDSQNDNEPLDSDPDNTTTSPPVQSPNSIVSDRMPIAEHYAIWSFSYAVNIEALKINQIYLAKSFRQVDLNFCHNYRYSFDTLLLIQNGIIPEVDNTVYDSSMILNPQIYSYDKYNYVLYVYDLIDSTRLIFYIDALSQDCMGYIIQEL